MTTIRQQDFIDSIADALQFISYYHPADFIRALADAYRIGAACQNAAGSSAGYSKTRAELLLMPAACVAQVRPSSAFSTRV